jgi:hypothetical protein
MPIVNLTRCVASVPFSGMKTPGDLAIAGPFQYG